MSRQSQAMATGQPAFSWRVERIETDAYGRPTRYVATCRNHPAVKAFGDTEEAAIRAATKAITAAAEQADLGFVSAGQTLTPPETPAE